MQLAGSEDQLVECNKNIFTFDSIHNAMHCKIHHPKLHPTTLLLHINKKLISLTRFFANISLNSSEFPNCCQIPRHFPRQVNGQREALITLTTNCTAYQIEYLEQ